MKRRRPTCPVCGLETPLPYGDHVFRCKGCGAKIHQKNPLAVYGVVFALIFCAALVLAPLLEPLLSASDLLLGTLISLIALAVFVVLVLLFRRDPCEILKRGAECPSCNYDLYASVSDTCPECGADVRALRDREEGKAQ